jgi:DNA polymerase elongation subunit (family B)
MSDIDYSKIIPSKIENYFSKIYISYYQNGIKKYDNFPYLGYYYTCDSKEPIVKKEDCQKIMCDNAYQMLQLSKEQSLPTYQADLKLHRIFTIENFQETLKEQESKIAFIDIENYEVGRIKVDNPNIFINAISIYNSKSKKLLTFAYKPQTTEINEENNIYIYPSEFDLLDNFLKYMTKEKFDIVTGWNCLNKNENIWQNDKIISLEKIETNQKLFENGSIKNKSNITKKDAYKIQLHNGSYIISSIDHIFPTYFKFKKEWKRPETLIKNKEDLKIKDIINEFKNKDFYFKINLRKNENKDLSYRDLIVNNFNIYMNYSPLEMFFNPRNFDYSIRGKLKKYIKNFRGDIERCISLNDLLKNVSIEFVKEKLKTIDYLYITILNISFKVNLNEIINKDDLQLLGFLYTDGFYSKYDNQFEFCNKDKDLIFFYSDLMNKFRLNKINKEFLKPNKRDNCFYLHMGRGNLFSLFMPFIYNKEIKKSINIELLSQLSFEQFKSFFSGLIDGDGWIEETYVGLCNYEHNNYKDDIFYFQELLMWNGIYNTVRNNKLYIPSLKGKNVEFIKNLNIYQSKRKEKIKIIREINYKNSTNKIINYFKYDNFFLSKIKKIEKLEEKQEMYDIETETNYFVSSSIDTHNCEKYDIPVICFRLEYYKILNRLSPHGKVQQKFHSNEFDIYGISIIDYIPLFKKYDKVTLPSYKLESVANSVLKKGKIKFKGSFNNLWKENIHEFIRYNREDTMLVKEIEDKRKYLKLITEIRNISCVNFEEVLANSIVLDNLFLRKMNKEGYVVKTAPEHRSSQQKKEDLENGIGEDKESFAGAYVKEPRPGIRNFVIDLDSTSQYPSTIMYLNTSPETKIGKILNLVGIFYFNDEKEYEVQMNDCERTMTLNQKELHEFLKKTGYIISANGVIFKNKEQGYGFVPQITEWIFNQRDQYKKLRDQYKEDVDDHWLDFEIKQKAYKELSVSIYGVMGFSSSRFFDIDLAEAITLSSQKIIKKEIALIEEKNFDVNASDTDSSLISFPLTFKNYVGKIIDDKTVIYKGETKKVDSLNNFFKENKCFYHGKILYGSEMYDIESCTQVGNDLSKYVDKEILDFVKYEFNSHYAKFHYKNEFVAKKAIFAVKKHYALHVVLKELKERDEIIYKGLEVVRTDTPEFAKVFLKKIYENLLKEDNIDEIFKIIDDYRNEIKIINRNEIGIPTTVKALEEYKSNSTIHVRGAEIWEKYYAKEYNIGFDDTNKGFYFYLDEKFIPERMKDIEKKQLENFVITIPEGQELPEELKINYEKFEDRLVDKKLETIIKILDFYRIEQEIVDYYTIYCSDIYKFCTDMLKKYFEESKNEKISGNTNFEKFALKNKNLKYIYNCAIVYNYQLGNIYKIEDIEDFIKEKILRRDEEEKNFLF